VNQEQPASSLHFSWHSVAVLVNLSCPTMLFSDSSHAASSKFEQDASTTVVVVVVGVVVVVVVEVVVF